jgi:hypothetical protein
LREEFEAALAVARSGSGTGSSAKVIVYERAAQREIAEPVSTVVEPPRHREERRELLPEIPVAPDRSRLVIGEIRECLGAGDLVRACDRFDLARSAGEIDLSTETEMELELAQEWLANTALDTATLAQIVRRYRWDDVVPGFPLGWQIVERLHAAQAPIRKPGQRYVGKWNWGAFFLAPFWLMAHGLVRRGIVVLAVGVASIALPFGLVALLWIAIDYGKNGNALALKHRAFTSDEQFSTVQNAWRNWGLAVVITATILISGALGAIVTLYH